MKNYFLSFTILCCFNLEFLTIEAQECGKGKSELGRIFGGGIAEEAEWPWSVALVNREKEKFLCSGTLISDKHVLSAAQCFQNKRDREPLSPFLVEALLGKFNSSVEDEAGSETLLVSEILVHPDWKNSRVKFDADLSVVVLERKVTFTDSIQPICLPEQSDDVVIGTGAVVGWGKSETSEGAFAVASSKLQILDVFPAACFSSIGEILKYPTTRTFCGGYESIESAPCLSNSGGGFFLRNRENFWAIQGLISGSKAGERGCSRSTFAFFTQVAKFADWIKEKMRETKASNDLIVRFTCGDGYDASWIECSTYFQYPMTRNLKIRANFPPHETQHNPIDVTNLKINFSPSTHISSGVGAEFPNLRQLVVEGDSIKYMERQSFANLTQLDRLTIRQTSVEFLPSDLITDLPNLTVLKINFCFQLERFSEKFFMNQRKLKSLSLNANGLTVLQKDLFKYNLELQEVHFWGNNLLEIYVDFTYLQAVEWIDLRENKCIDKNWTPMNDSMLSFQDLINRGCSPKSA